jgi:undecaprenyl diphosphate synthase
VRRTVEGCREHGIRYLTLFAFSSENWRRPASEVNELMNLLRFYLRREINELARSGVRLRFLGEREVMAGDIAAMMAEAEERTRRNTVLTLTIALNYGSRREIARAAREIAERAVAGELECAAIDEELFGRTLNTLGLPDPDLLIRTSGEQRLSNFMLWQMAYTELVFLPVHWPDFDQHHLGEAIAEFRRRERRYGASSG